MARRSGCSRCKAISRRTAAALERAGARAGVCARRAAQLDEIDGLIIPGGESTTMLKLLHDEDLIEPLAEFGRRKPMFGTCAGAILMASEVSSPAQESLGLMDIAVERNAYGRQIDSRVAHSSRTRIREAHGAGQAGGGLHPRADHPAASGNGAEVLAQYKGDPVLVEQGRHLVATFHPELTADTARARVVPGEAVSRMHASACFSCASAIPAAARWRRASRARTAAT